jgi:hypothetical protein
VVNISRSGNEGASTMNQTLLFAALYLSEGWYTYFVDNLDSPYAVVRRKALYGRARAVVLYDRTLAGETTP